MGRRKKDRTLKVAATRRTKKVAGAPPVVTAINPRQPHEPDVLEVSVSSLATIAVEWWRLDRWAAGSDEAQLVARHVARRLARFLEDQGMEIVDLTGTPYDARLAVEVVDSVRSGSARSGPEIIIETVSPIVRWNGKVARHGQVVIGREES